MAQRTATINALLWRVHELDPGQAPKPRSLDLAKHQQALRAWMVTVPGNVAELALDELDDAIALTGRINVLAWRITRLRTRGVRSRTTPNTTTGSRTRCVPLGDAHVPSSVRSTSRQDRDAGRGCHPAGPDTYSVLSLDSSPTRSRGAADDVSWTPATWASASAKQAWAECRSCWSRCR